MLIQTKEALGFAMQILPVVNKLLLWSSCAIMQAMLVNSGET